MSDCHHDIEEIEEEMVGLRVMESQRQEKCLYDH
jgi:hypothetical protein